MPSAAVYESLPGGMLAQQERVVQGETQGENGKRYFLPKLVVQRAWFIIMA